MRSGEVGLLYTAAALSATKQRPVFGSDCHLFAPGGQMPQFPTPLTSAPDAHHDASTAIERSATINRRHVFRHVFGSDCHLFLRLEPTSNLNCLLVFPISRLDSATDQTPSAIVVHTNSRIRLISYSAHVSWNLTEFNTAHDPGLMASGLSS